VREFSFLNHLMHIVCEIKWACHSIACTRLSGWSQAARALTFRLSFLAGVQWPCFRIDRPLPPFFLFTLIIEPLQKGARGRLENEEFVQSGQTRLTSAVKRWPHQFTDVTAFEPVDCIKVNTRTRLTALRCRALLVKQRPFFRNQ